MSGQDIGTLYVLANRDMSLAKVGMTRNGSPDTRADSYSREHGIEWHVFWMRPTQRVREAEAAAHRMMAAFRFSEVPGAREIFHLTPAKARAYAEQCVTPLEPAASVAVTSPPTGQLAPHNIIATATLTKEQHEKSWQERQEWKQPRVVAQPAAPPPPPPATPHPQPRAVAQPAAPPPPPPAAPHPPVKKPGWFRRMFS
jgi:hypothetical protein